MNILALKQLVQLTSKFTLANGRTYQISRKNNPLMGFIKEGDTIILNEEKVVVKSLDNLLKLASIEFRKIEVGKVTYKSETMDYIHHNLEVCDDFLLTI